MIGERFIGKEYLCKHCKFQYRLKVLSYSFCSTLTKHQSF